MESNPHSIAVDRLAWFTGAREGEDRLARYRELIEDARAFCAWLGTKDGLTYTVPDEELW